MCDRRAERHDTVSLSHLAPATAASLQPAAVLLSSQCKGLMRLGLQVQAQLRAFAHVAMVCHILGRLRRIPSLTQQLSLG